MFSKNLSQPAAPYGRGQRVLYFLTFSLLSTLHGNAIVKGQVAEHFLYHLPGEGGEKQKQNSYTCPFAIKIKNAISCLVILLTRRGG